MRVGIFGGTFDPIHLGHLLIGASAFEQLSLDRVLIMPAQSPPHKQDRDVTPAADRVAMVRAAIEADPRLELSRLDLDSDAPSYTADLLDRYQAASPDHDLWFIVGEDSLQDFPTWHDPQRILRHARLAVARRPGYDKDDILVDGSSIHRHIDRFDAPLVDISSTEIRERVKQRRSITWWVPASVERMIDERALYRSNITPPDGTQPSR